MVEHLRALLQERPRRVVAREVGGTLLEMQRWGTHDVLGDAHLMSLVEEGLALERADWILGGEGHAIQEMRHFPWVEGQEPICLNPN